MTSAIEYGFAGPTEKAEGIDQVTVSAPSVTSTSSILLTVDPGATGATNVTAIILDRNPGVGFKIQTSEPEPRIDWVIIN